MFCLVTEAFACRTLNKKLKIPKRFSEAVKSSNDTQYNGNKTTDERANKGPHSTTQKYRLNKTNPHLKHLLCY